MQDITRIAQQMLLLPLSHNRQKFVYDMYFNKLFGLFCFIKIVPFCKLFRTNWTLKVLTPMNCLKTVPIRFLKKGQDHLQKINILPLSHLNSGLTHSVLDLHYAIVTVCLLCHFQGLGLRLWMVESVTQNIFGYIHTCNEEEP